MKNHTEKEVRKVHEKHAYGVMECILVERYDRHHCNSRINQTCLSLTTKNRPRRATKVYFPLGALINGYFP